MPEITRYKVICGSNGKVGTRFNTVIIPKEQKGRVIVKETIDNGSVGRKLTDKEFVELYPKQCNIFFFFDCSIRLANTHSLHFSFASHFK